MSSRKPAAPAGDAVFLVSLGCSKNLVDTEVIAGTLLTSGRTLVFTPEEANLYIINTCAFIPAAREEAFDAIREGIEWKKESSGRKLVVAGCLTEWDKSGEITGRYPEVDLWTGVNQVAAIAELLDGSRPLPGRRETPTYLYDENTPRLQLTLPHLAHLKIADGCDNRCTYCSIPGIRGTLRTRPMESVLREARNLLDGGVRELLVIAQDVTAYGHDRPGDGETLAGLLEKLDALDGDFTIRLLYTHPAHYTPELIDFLARPGTKVLPYLDMPLQHISDRILRAMNRHVTRAEIEALLTRLRERIADLTLRTTFITGFPGETEEEFAELETFLKKFKFERCGVFPYSPEPDTPAAAFADRVSAETAEARAEKLMKVQRAIMKKANRSWIGREVRMLVDEIDGRAAIGRASMDAPEIDNRIVALAPRRLRTGDFARVRITAADSYEFTGEILR